MLDQVSPELDLSWVWTEGDRLVLYSPGLILWGDGNFVGMAREAKVEDGLGVVLVDIGARTSVVV